MWQALAVREAALARRRRVHRRQRLQVLDVGRRARRRYKVEQEAHGREPPAARSETPRRSTRCRRSKVMTTAARLARLGLRLGPLGAPTLVAVRAAAAARRALVLIPHGRTPNQRLIFQDHSGARTRRYPESLVEAGKAPRSSSTPSRPPRGASGGRRCTVAQTRTSTRRPLPAAAWRFPRSRSTKRLSKSVMQLARQDRGGARGRGPRRRRRASGGRRACEAARRRVAARRVLKRAAAWVQGRDEPERVVVAGHGRCQNAIEVVCGPTVRGRRPGLHARAGQVPSPPGFPRGVPRGRWGVGPFGGVAPRVMLKRGNRASMAY